ncbi:MAG: flagellar basal body-associated FliL family protein [Pseudomonadota bacterium]
MADTPETPEAAETKSSGGFMGTVILAVAALISALATVYVLTPSQAPLAVAAGECEPAMLTSSAIKPLATEDQTYVEMEEILITIGSTPATRYLKMNLQIITDKDGAAKIKKAEPVLKDAFINYLRSVELQDFENPNFYSQMRDQMARRAELVVGGSVARGVLITEFLLR